MKKFIKIILIGAVIIGSGIFAYEFMNRSIEVYDSKEQKVKIQNKNLFLFIWSSNCTACFYSIPHINFLKQQVEEAGGQLILVLSDENIFLRKMAIAHFIRLNMPGLSTYYDKGGKLQKKYKIAGLPTLLIFDKNGKLVRRIEGFVQWGQDPALGEILSLIK